RLGIKPEEAFNDFGANLLDTYGTLYGAFEAAAANPKALEAEGIEGDWTDIFYEVAKENVTPPYVQISGQLELRCPAPDGIECIKKALFDGMDGRDERMTVQYIGAPRYRVVMTAAEYKEAEEELKEVTNIIINSIKECGGEGTFTRETNK
ncbi:MAG TPA: translation initiation factor IF-2 subunit alpha, partial [Methanomassiliicoccales archaeon]|nr:translation initiation factor IF-2 subunit alpha [Methanomassiliicoccales archaeon]